MFQRSRRDGPARSFILAGALGLTAAATLATLGPNTATASSHREAPLIAGLPQYDTTDVYAFRSPERTDTVTLIANWLPFSEPGGGPNFYAFATDANYNIKVDNNGNGKPDITFRWTFKNNYVNKNTFLYANGPVTSLTDPNLNFYQTYTLVKYQNNTQQTLVKDRRVVPSNVGAATMPDYASLRNKGISPAGPGGVYRSFVGQAEDPFFLDLRVFDLLYGGDFSEVGDDTLAGFNVNSVALQVPRNILARNRNAVTDPVIGVWSTTERRGVNGAFTQVSRLGMPLVNEVVIPLKDKDRFNASVPSGDGQFLNYVTKPELPKLIKAVYGVPAPAEPRTDLVSVFLTGVKGLNQPKAVTPSEQLRLNMNTPVTASPDRLGVIGGDTQGFPNGRRLADDVVDIALQVVEGELLGSANDLGDAVNTNDKAFGKKFPYLAMPYSGSDPAPHPVVAPASAAEKSLIDEAMEALRDEAVAGVLTGLGGGGMLLGGVMLYRSKRRSGSLSVA